MNWDLNILGTNRKGRIWSFWVYVGPVALYVSLLEDSYRWTYGGELQASER